MASAIILTFPTLTRPAAIPKKVTSPETKKELGHAVSRAERLLATSTDPSEEQLRPHRVLVSECTADMVSIMLQQASDKEIEANPPYYTALTECGISLLI